MTEAAQLLAPLVRALVGGDLPLRLRAWDGSQIGPDDSPATVVLRSPRALRRLLWRSEELGLARAYVAGDLDVEGDIYAVLSLPDLLESRPELRLSRRDRLTAAGLAARLGALGPAPPPPPEEFRAAGRRHTRSRDAAAIAHHYDVGNEFYRLVLGPSMVYSCAYWASKPSPSYDLAAAQTAKCELVARKLALGPGVRLLDVGCGWGTMAIHAAAEHGAYAVGVTVSEQQAALARKRVADAGVADRVEIRVQDYRDVQDGPYDAISSIGMAEHVGAAQGRVYADRLWQLLRPEGRLLHHAISRRPGPDPAPDDSFLRRYVFPDGELSPVGLTVSTLEEAGFEVRDVEALREHYALTLREWVRNLEAGWDEAVRLSSPGRARVWRMYMAGAALAFERNRTGVNQVLAVRPDGRGASGFPLTRAALQLPD
jgi:cyclopropane-fatty-acyl-phospholipid synthase